MPFKSDSECENVIDFIISISCLVMAGEAYISPLLLEQARQPGLLKLSRPVMAQRRQ